MKGQHLLVPLFAMVLMLGLAPAAKSALVIVDTLETPAPTGIPVSGDPLQWLAAPFIPAGDVRPGFVAISLAEVSVSGSYSVEIWSDNAGLPGSVVTNGVLTQPAILLSDSVALFEVNPSIELLTAGQPYWVVATIPGGSTDVIQWNLAFTDTPIFSGTGIAPSVVAFSTDSGTTWGSAPDTIALFAVVVPEPASLALLSLGGLALLVRRRSRI